VTDRPGPRLRPALHAVPAYRPGRPAASRDGAPAYKLSSNENPYPPLPSVLETVRQSAAAFNRYPDMFATGLTQAIADRFDVPASHVATGTGSVGVLQQVVQSTAAEGDDVVYAWRSFEAYPIVVAISGATSVPVPLTSGEHHDLDAMLDAVTDRTRLVLVCTPNNPTGTAVRRQDLERFLDALPPDVLVVIDEAYREFVRDPDVPDALEVYRDRPNVAVLRTFSKAYGLAGLRVGFAVAHEPALGKSPRRSCQRPPLKIEKSPERTHTGRSSVPLQTQSPAALPQNEATPPAAADKRTLPTVSTMPTLADWPGKVKLRLPRSGLL
jgi:histidinol-phosphate aminotransferase